MATGRGFIRGAAPWLGLGGWALLLGCSAPPAPVASLSEQNARSVELPARFGWLSSKRDTGVLPSAIALGSQGAGRVLLYFEFQQPAEARRLLRAELLLGVSGPPGVAVPVEVSRSQAAHAQLVAWSEQPSSLYPSVPGVLAVSAAPVRVDVTEILRAGAKPGEPLRLLLHAEPGEQEPLLVDTGAAGGPSPRLETYWE